MMRLPFRRPRLRDLDEARGRRLPDVDADLDVTGAHENTDGTSLGAKEPRRRRDVDREFGQ